MREQDRKEFLTMFFGRVVTRDVVGFAEPGAEAPRPMLWDDPKKAKAAPKPVSIGAYASMSPHVVDLTSFSNRPYEGPRPELDFEQKFSAFVHSVRSAVPAVEDEHRSFMPLNPTRKPRRAPIGGFLKLPFALAALPFRAKTPKPVAAKKIVLRKAAPLPRAVAPAPKPLAMPKPVAAPAPVPMLAARPVARTMPVIKTMPESARPKMTFMIDTGWFRRVGAFALVAVVVSLPLMALLSYTGLLARAGAIAAGAKEAAVGLRDAGQAALAADGSASGAFDRAAGAFADTRGRVDDISVRLAALLTGNGGKLSSGAKLLAAGEAVSRAGAELASGAETMEGSDETNAAKLGRMAQALASALPYLETATAQLDDVPASSLPAAYRSTFEDIRSDAAGAVADLKRVSESSGILLGAIGAQGKRRYLVVFQNNDELRPTGGFIGSYALMDLKDGSIEKMEIPAGGSYDLRGGLNQRIQAPEQLRLVNARWEFQDANWFADFPTSARSLIWFYEKSGGPTVDGVIAVTSDVMEDLLREVGPIAMPEYGKTIDAANFQTETQKAVEVEYDRETNKPKQIISDMAPKLLEKLVDGGSADLPALAGVLGRALASKDIQVYFSDADVQTAAEGFGWTGELKPLDGADFLSVVDTNIAGGKTDGVVKEDIRHEARVDQDGSIVDTVTVTRTHGGVKGDLFTGVKNIDYMRFYVPQGSQLLSAEGFEAPGQGYFLPDDGTLKPSTLLAAVDGRTASDEKSGTTINDESGLTVFGNWVQVEPGASRTVKISYRLPFRVDDLVKAPTTRWQKVREALGAWTPTAALKLVVRKQPGAANRTFASRTYLPGGWSIRSSVPSEAKATSDAMTLETPLDQDLYVGMLLAKKN